MTINDILKAKGLDDEQIKAILAEMKENKIFIASEENLDVRYGKLKADHDGMNQQLTEANNLIAELKKSSVGQDELQNKIVSYEEQIKSLAEQLESAKIDNAIKVGLMTVKAIDADYLGYKLRESLKKTGEALKLDEDGSIAGWNDKVAGLRTQFPNMFASDTDTANGLKVFDPNKLKDSDNKETVTNKESFMKLSYEERVALKERNETLYKQLAK